MMAMLLGRRLSNSSSTRGKTLGNILSRCDTTGMEGTHGQLEYRARRWTFCCDDTDGLPSWTGSLFAISLP